MKAKEKDTVLEFRNIKKKFPGVLALDDVSFDIKEGHVHAICGENGAGKSTLINIMFGLLEANEGQILMKSQPVRITSPRVSRELGMRMISQEIDYCPNLMVAENIFLGGIQQKFVDRRQMLRETEKLIEYFNLNFKATDKASKLSVSQKQQMRIVKTYFEKPKIVLMDEPNSSLNKRESEVLFEIVKQFKQQGITVVYVSHRINEVLDIADRVTVLRNGKHIATEDAADVTVDKVIEMIVGKDVPEVHKHREEKKDTAADDCVFSVKDFTFKGNFYNVSFSVNKGEIVGLFGLKGSGIEPLISSLFGIYRADSGKIYVNGDEETILTPEDAVDAGLSYIPSDRKEWGIVPRMDIESNIVLSNVNEVSRWGLLEKKRIYKQSLELVARLSVACRDTRQKIVNLSGGNQQKVLIARNAIFQKPDVLLLSDPTRGVDVGSRAEIHQILIKLAEQGLSIIASSSEVDELLTISDRIIVFKDGEVITSVEASETSEEQLLATVLSATPKAM